MTLGIREFDGVLRQLCACHSFWGPTAIMHFNAFQNPEIIRLNDFKMVINLKQRASAETKASSTDWNMEDRPHSMWSQCGGQPSTFQLVDTLELGSELVRVLPTSTELLGPFCVSLLSSALTFNYVSGCSIRLGPLSMRESKISVFFENTQGSLHSSSVFETLLTKAARLCFFTYHFGTEAQIIG